MAVLLLASHDKKSLSPETARALSAANSIGAEIDILVAGDKIDQVAQAATEFAGVRKVLLAQAPHLEHQLAESLGNLLYSLAGNYTHFITAANAVGKSVMPRLAALLDVMQLSEIISVISPDIFKRPAYAGNIVETIKSLDPKKVITVRYAAFEGADKGGNAPIEEVAVPQDKALSRFICQEQCDRAQVSLSSASIVVSGGRAFGSLEDFKTLLEPLAARLGAAIGASRAAVDAGYAPNDWQIGQTGKAVAPEIYIAFGISGAIQHIAGIMDAKIIVAVNHDPDAPIFQIADYGLVGDIFEIIPELIKAL